MCCARDAEAGIRSLVCGVEDTGTNRCATCVLVSGNITRSTKGGPGKRNSSPSNTACRRRQWRSLCCDSTADGGGAPAGSGLGDGHEGMRRGAAEAPVTTAWTRDGLAMQDVDVLRSSPACSGKLLLRCTK